MATKQIISKRYGVTNFVEDMDRLFKNGRGTGNTTRQADFLIQLLFENKDKWVPIIDHASLNVDENQSKIINQYLIDKIKNRLSNEHAITNHSKIQLEEKTTFHLPAHLEHDDYYDLLLNMFRSTDRTVFMLKLKDRK